MPRLLSPTTRAEFIRQILKLNPKLTMEDLINADEAVLIVMLNGTPPKRNSRPKKHSRKKKGLLKR